MPEAYVPSERVARLKAETFGKDLTLAEVAHILDVDRTTVLRYIHEHRLFAYQLGREWRVPEDDLRAFVAALQRKDR